MQRSERVKSQAFGAVVSSFLSFLLHESTSRRFETVRDRDPGVAEFALVGESRPVFQCAKRINQVTARRTAELQTA